MLLVTCRMKRQSGEEVTRVCPSVLLIEEQRISDETVTQQFRETPESPRIEAAGIWQERIQYAGESEFLWTWWTLVPQVIPGVVWLTRSECLLMCPLAYPRVGIVGDVENYVVTPAGSC